VSGPRLPLSPGILHSHTAVPASATDYVKVVSPGGATNAGAHASGGSSPAPKSPSLPTPPPNKPSLFGSVTGSAVGGGIASLFAAALVGLLSFVFPSRSTSRVASANAVPHAYRQRLSLERPG
jgi:hypothetical protein